MLKLSSRSTVLRFYAQLKNFDNLYALIVTFRSFESNVRATLNKHSLPPSQHFTPSLLQSKQVQHLITWHRSVELTIFSMCMCICIIISIFQIHIQSTINSKLYFTFLFGSWWLSNQSQYVILTLKGPLIQLLLSESNTILGQTIKKC